MLREDFLTDNSERAQEVRRNGEQVRQLTNREATEQEMNRQHALVEARVKWEAEKEAATPSRLDALRAMQNKSNEVSTPRLDALKIQNEMTSSPEVDLAQWMRGITQSKDTASQAASDAYTANQTNSKGAETESHTLSPPSTPTALPPANDGGESSTSSPQMSTMVIDICVDGVAKKLKVYVDGAPY